MRKNKLGHRNIHLHDADAIEYVEILAEDMNCTLYQAVEKIIHDNIRTELLAPTEAVEKKVFGVSVSNQAIPQLITIFHDEGYDVDVEHLSSNDSVIRLTSGKGREKK